MHLSLLLVFTPPHPAHLSLLPILYFVALFYANARKQPFPYAGQAVFILTLPYLWWFSGMTAKIRGSVVKEISSISNYQMGYNV